MDIVQLMAAIKLYQHNGFYIEATSKLNIAFTRLQEYCKYPETDLINKKLTVMLSLPFIEELRQRLLYDTLKDTPTHIKELKKFFSN